ncbi:hypothetical protein WMY93_025973 [Mugilogobius chulae]|uniref:Eph LBD domain-containing protein n=1 Tax=Mugilogobius chulae TaxID=88201 RepID=A0AAW0MW65_9GOBI
MWSIFVAFCVVFQPNSAEDVMMLDTSESTSELGWTTYPDTGWDEVSVLDDKGKLIRTFEVCNVNQNSRLQDNWLATPFLFRRSAPRVFVTLKFSVRDCASLRSPSPSCRETLTLYYKQADSQRELERTWAAEPSSGDRETREGWVKIDTIAADKSFSKVEPSSPHQYQPNRYSRINVKTRSFAPLTRNGFVLAIVDSGACVSLMGVSIFFRRCPATSLHLASYPATPSGAEPTALVPVTGTCVPHSKAQGGPPRMHCNAEGEWMVPVGGCVCDEGYEPNHNGSACLVYKCVHGLSPSPLNEFIKFRSEATERRTRASTRGDCTVPLRRTAFSRQGQSAQLVPSVACTCVVKSGVSGTGRSDKGGRAASRRQDELQRSERRGERERQEQCLTHLGHERCNGHIVCEQVTETAGMREREGERGREGEICPIIGREGNEREGVSKREESEKRRRVRGRRERARKKRERETEREKREGGEREERGRETRERGVREKESEREERKSKKERERKETERGRVRDKEKERGKKGRGWQKERKRGER